MLEGYDTSQLVCHHSRIVTDRGVFVCPILIESPTARLGDTLAEAQRPFAIDQGACFTCYQYSASRQRREAERVTADQGRSPRARRWLTSSITDSMSAIESIT